MKTKVNYKKYGSFPDMDTVKEIIIYGAENGKDKKQIVFTNFSGEVETKTFNQTFYDTVGLGQYLYKIGMRGKKVAILSENSYYWLAAFYSIATAKITAVPLDPKLTAEELTDIMVRSGCSGIYYAEEFLPVIEMMKKKRRCCYFGIYLY